MIPRLFSKRTAAAFILLLLSLPAVAQKKISDSLLVLISKDKDDTVKVDHLHALVKAYTTRGDYDSAHYFCKQALTLSNRLNYARGVIAYYSNIGFISQNQGNFFDALKNFTESLNLSLAAGDRSSAAVAYNNVGVVHRNQGNYLAATQHYLAALKIYEDLNDKKGKAMELSNLGVVYRLQGEYDKALENFNIVLQIDKELDDKRGIANIYNNVGNVYWKKKDDSSALSYYRLSLRIKQEIGDLKGQAGSYNNIGTVYVGEHRPQEAIKNYIRSKEIYEQTRNKAGLALVLNNLGSCYYEVNDLRKAREYFNKGLAYAHETGDLDLLHQSYKGLMGLDSSEGNFKSAYYNYKLSVAYSDSLNNEENTKRSMQAVMQYEFDKQQTADSIRNEEQRKQEELKHTQEIRQQQLYTYGGLLGFVLMLLVALISFNAFRQKQKANAIISEQKALVEEKQREVLDSIAYARRIQLAQLPSESYIARSLQRLKGRKDQ